MPTMAPLRRSARNHNKRRKIADPKMKISDVNDHCMLKIFDYLSSIDMCAVKDTCHRFRGLAEKHMQIRYRSNELVLSDRTRTVGSNIYKQMKVFYKFCGILKHLDISVLDITWHQENDVNVFSTIRKCSPKLDSLTLTGTNFDLARNRLNKIFPHLRKIKLEYFDAVEFEYDIRREDIIKEMYKACTNVEEIYFGARVSSMGCRYQGIFLQQKFKKLRSLELYEVRDFDLNNLIIFLKLNPNLQRITLKQCVRLKEISYINFVKNAPNIEGISVSFNTLDHTENENTVLRGANELYKLDKLKYLAFDTCGTRITDFITSMAQRDSLVYLSLTRVKAKLNEGLAESFRNMKNLKVFRLYICFYHLNTSEFKDFYKILSKNLVNLVELHLSKSRIMFQQIADIIDNSNNLKRLYLPPMHFYEELNEENYLVLAAKRYKKNATSQLTILLDSDSYATVISLIPSNVLRANSHLVKLSQFDSSQFNDYWLPNSI